MKTKTIFPYDEKITSEYLAANGFSDEMIKSHLETFGPSLVFAEAKVWGRKDAAYRLKCNSYDKDIIKNRTGGIAQTLAPRLPLLRVEWHIRIHLWRFNWRGTLLFGHGSTL